MPLQAASATVTLTTDERAKLVSLLQAALGEVRVEAHHTHTPGFREDVLAEETLIKELLAKLRGPASA